MVTFIVLQYVFTLGLSTSTILDILITGILCFYLRRRRSGMAKLVNMRVKTHVSLTTCAPPRMDRIISMLTLYTVENGMLTWYDRLKKALCMSSQ